MIDALIEPLTESLIESDNVTIRFKTKTGYVDAVRGSSFQVGEGEVFGIVGESGSGKSTVLRALCGLAPITEGRMRIGKHDVAKNIDRTFRRRVQMVFQDPYGSLHPRFTVDQTLREPLSINGIGDAERRILDALREVGLGPAFRFRYAHQLSGGQRQRVAIARALILEPRVLLLDEPTSALDVSVQAEILNLLRRLHRERNLTMILVSHNMAVVGFLCQKVAVMRNGEIVEQLSIDEVREQRVAHEYTRRLLLATQGYRREGSAAAP
jgi:peptide/nickel transport system ATP-binding protein